MPPAIKSFMEGEIGKAQNKFFEGLQAALGREYIVGAPSKNQGESSYLRLDKELCRNNFSAGVRKQLRVILKELGATEPFPTGSIAHNIDGLIVQHPQLGTRIVEFDEIQHFSPFRWLTCQPNPHLEISVPDHYHSVFCSAKWINRMLKKNRLPRSNDPVSLLNTKKFRAYVELHFSPNTGYIKPVKGFDFPGGRIAQRAYYDSLKDLACFSNANKHLSSTIRYSEVELEEKFGENYLSLEQRILTEYISVTILERAEKLSI